MTWEQRGNRRYYYRKKRNGSRVTTEYVGTGTVAVLLAEKDRQDREKFLHTRQKWRAQKSEFKNVEQDHEFLMVITRGLVRAIFLTSGYHPHKGQWRKKHHD